MQLYDVVFLMPQSPVRFLPYGPEVTKGPPLTQKGPVFGDAVIGLNPWQAQPGQKEKMTVTEHFAGLDVSLETTAVGLHAQAMAGLHAVPGRRANLPDHEWC